ncbi:MAG: hypothetical protein HY263_02400 [Chloroflexi bacterium]|nr:hypothetical protein [Chloroflexota bacterium]
MARPLFEQYKDALRRGHLALLGDELDAALAAYREAASLVPDRPLPHASIGEVLGRLHRRDEALAAYDLALTLAPGDPAVMSAREVVVASIAAAQRGVGSQPAPEAEPRGAAAPEASPVREAAAAAAAAAAEAAAVAAGEAAVAAAARAAADDHQAALDAMRAALERADGRPAGTADPGAVEPEVAASPTGAAPGAPPGAWPAIDLPSLPQPPLEGPPPNPAVLQAEADELLDAGDEQGARDRLILAAIVHRDAGRLDAAIDACLQLLAIAPGDPRVHLAIANLQLDLGWRPVATEKIELLLRLTSLAGDAQAEADVHLLAADRLRDESPARLDARRRGLPTP